MVGKTGCVLPWLPLSKCCIDLSTCCFPKHWHVSNRIRGQIDWRDTEMEIKKTKNTDAGVRLLGVTSGWLRRTQAPSQGDRVRRVWHLCVSSIFIRRPSSNTAASPKDQGRCFLHFWFLKGACGLSSFQGSFELKLCIKELTVTSRRAILQEKPIEAAGGGCCQANFIREFSTANKIAFRQSDHDKDVNPILLDWGSKVQFWNWLCSS